MRKVSVTSIPAVLLIIFSVSLSPAGAAHTINYQGYLTTSSGAPADFPLGVNMRFSLWDSDTGSTELWNEVQNVVVNQGIYSVALGSLTALPGTLDFTSPYYLQVEIDDGAGGWELFSGRQKLTSVAVAINADMLDGKHAVDLDQSSHVSDTSNPHNVTAAQVGAATMADINNHAGDPSAHHTKTTSFTELTGQIADGQIPDSITRDSELAALQAQINTLQGQVAALQDILQHFSRSGNDIYITGANLHIVNGTGTTDGTVNGLGNLIVGYNETRGTGDDRTGSHNIVVGSKHNYSSYGGLVAGFHNEISGPYSSVSGGWKNTASGYRSSISGGYSNIASGYSSSVSGGAFNTASGDKSSVSGGFSNEASGDESSVSGGYKNTASGYRSSVSGGTNNIAFANYSSILGGYYNLAGDGVCQYNGGTQQPECSPGTDHYIGQYSIVAGGQANRSSGDKSSVSGGYWNTASGIYSSVSGGFSNTASGDSSSVSGGWFNTASSLYSSVGGGSNNTAGGLHSSVSGGYNRSVTGNYDWRAGGLFQDN
jgi:hypothetical protein